jgi:glycosyltransferase involved in cell wall biosynthesis
MLFDIKKQAHRFRGLWRESKYRTGLKQQNIDLPRRGIVLSYGPAIGDLSNIASSVTGGKVKLLYLQEKYPHGDSRYNVLYLVSSALPPYAVILARWVKSKGVKVVLNQNGVGYPGWTKDHQSINSELSIVLSLADLVIYQSQFCKDAADYFLREASCPWTILFNCTDLDKFKPETVRAPSSPLRLLVAGSHYQRERVTLALRALRLLLNAGLDVELVIAGPIPWDRSGAEIIKLTDTLKLSESVRVIGPYSHNVAPTIYQSADILLHLKYKDPCPNVVIEAMASGVPVVGSSSGGLRELIGSEGGLLLPVVDSWNSMYYPSAVDIASGVEKIFDNLGSYRKRSRQRAEQLFSSTSWVGAHEKWLNSLFSRD